LRQELERNKWKLPAILCRAKIIRLAISDGDWLAISFAGEHGRLKNVITPASLTRTACHSH
jgi:hypothetical protein